MTGKDVYKIWAPPGAKWTDWCQPAPFTSINDLLCAYRICNFNIPEISYVSLMNMDTAIIVDVHGYDGIEEGLGLALMGCRPVPLYNGTMEQDGAMALVDNTSIAYALKWGASELTGISIDDDAAPVFLLDSDRLFRYKMDVSVFDNSWDVYDYNLPSAEYFKSNGINKIIVRSDKIHKDLAIILYGFQKKGITILYTNGYETPKEISVKKPPRKVRKGMF